MIASLKGKVLVKGPDRIILDVRGVGYDVAVSIPTLGLLPMDDEVFLHVHTALRENSLELYGFTEPVEKLMFEFLIGVSGIGPRLAMAVLSGIDADRFHAAVVDGDVNRLTAVPGIGKKTAERIVLELKEKMKKTPILSTRIARDSGGSLVEDLVSSLMNLGYKERDALATAEKVFNGDDNGLTLSQAVKLALKELST